MMHVFIMKRVFTSMQDHICSNYLSEILVSGPRRGPRFKAICLDFPQCLKLTDAKLLTSFITVTYITKMLPKWPLPIIFNTVTNFKTTRASTVMSKKDFHASCHPSVLKLTYSERRPSWQRCVTIWGHQMTLYLPLTPKP